MKSFLSKIITPTQLGVKSNELIFRVGDEVRFLYLVRSGQAKLVRYTSEGKQVITQLATEGNFIAEASIFTQKYHCDAVAIDQCELLAYPKNEVFETLGSNPDVSLEFIKFQSAEIKKLRNQVELINVLTAKERVLLFLRSSAENSVYILPVSLKNLASHIGLTHETLYRQLKILEDEGLISRKNKKIILC